MKKQLLIIAAFMSMSLFNSCGTTDDREAKAKDYLTQKIADESGNALKLDKFTKTNAVEKEVEGTKAYSLEWDAQISSVKDVWKDGVQMMGFHYFDDFKVKTKPDRNGVTSDAPHLTIGTNISLKGNSRFEKTEKGWRVVDCEVSSWKILK